MTKFIPIVLTLWFFNFNCNPSADDKNPTFDFPPVSEKMKGISFVAPPQEFSENPMPAIKSVGSDWVAVIPYAFTPNEKPELYFNSNRQWWGERPEGIKETVRLAQDANLKIVMKPQIWIRGGWVGSMDFSTKKDWEAWESDYRDYILTFAKIADSLNVEVFCIGTELKISVIKREKFWRSLIQEIKSIYQGKLIYAANWDEYEQVPFWDEMDFIGVDAYFPLVNKKTPSVSSLKKAWQPILKKLKKFSTKHNKPIVFSEFGYMSLDGCAYNTWELESKRSETPVNELAQANALDALFEVFWNEDWWGGGFIWKWYPNYQKGEGRRAKFRAGDYTPQGKQSEEILKKWYISEGK